jgi:hypothetical protein
MATATIHESPDETLQRLMTLYVANVVAYLQNGKLGGEPPDERFMRAVEEEAEIPEQGADDFRRTVGAMIGNIDVNSDPKLRSAIYAYRVKFGMREIKTWIIPPKKIDRAGISFSQWLEQHRSAKFQPGQYVPSEEPRPETIPYIFWDRRTSCLREFYMRDMLEYMNDWIAKSAYFIWEDEGHPVGRDMEHWFRALQQFVEAHT